MSRRKKLLGYRARLFLSKVTACCRFWWHLSYFPVTITMTYPRLLLQKKTWRCLLSSSDPSSTKLPWRANPAQLAPRVDSAPRRPQVGSPLESPRGLPRAPHAPPESSLTFFPSPLQIHLWPGPPGGRGGFLLSDPARPARPCGHAARLPPTPPLPPPPPARPDLDLRRQRVLPTPARGAGGCGSPRGGRRSPGGGTEPPAGGGPRVGGGVDPGDRSRLQE